MMMLDFALRYAGAGYRVIPCNGKIPLVPRGAHDATNDETTIRAWWERWPTANIGLTLEGLVVVDIDPRNGADPDEWSSKLPESCFARTGGGGLHYLYRTVNGTRYPGKLGAGVDVKTGAGAYIVVEPSIHASGEKYWWIDETEPWTTKPALAPAWLAQQPRESHTSDSTDAVSEGGRNNLLASLAGTMRRRGMSPEAIEAALLTENEKRCSPPLDDREVRQIARSVGRYTAEAEPTPAPVRFQIRRALDVANKPQYSEWLLRPYLERNVLALMFGELGTLKSFTALEFALTVASAQPSPAFPGAQVHGGNVIYISAEGKGMWRRLKGWSIARRIPLDACKLWVIEQPVDLYDQDSLLTLAEQINALGVKPDLIVADTLSRNCGSADENKTADMTALLNGIDKLLRVPFGCSVLIVHHVGHMEKGRARGSYALMANTDANFLLERPDPNRLVIELKTGRLKDSESPPPVCLEARVVELGTQDEDGRPARPAS